MALLFIDLLMPLTTLNFPDRVGKKGRCAMKNKLNIYIAVLISMSLVLMSFATISRGSDECPNGMVSYWTFDDSANPGKDDYGNSDGNVEGATWTNSGKVGGAMSFDGVNDYIWADDGREYSTFTFTTWVKLDPTVDCSSNVEFWPVKHSASKTQGGGELDKGLIIADGCYAWAYSYASGWYGAQSTDTLTTNVWYHLTAVGEGANGKIHIYINGELKGTVDQGPNNYGNPLPYIVIGQPYDTVGPDAYFHGIIDEVAIFNEALTASEIQQMYNNGLAGKGYCETTPSECPDGMVSYWKFDDPADPDKDHYGNNHGIAIVNADWDPNGKVEGSMRFYGTSYSGTDSYIDIGADPSLDMQTLSIATWIKPEQAKQFYGCYISHCGSGHNDGWTAWWGCCRLDENRQDTIVWGVQGVEGFSGNSHLDANWHFVVVTNDMSANERKIYVDGQLDGTDAAYAYGNHGSVRIGQDSCYAERFSGWLDEMAIFSRALTEAEIQEMYLNGLNGEGYCNTEVDNDGDGFFPPDDCDDNDNTVFPGAPDVCDGKDNDCDGSIDEEPDLTWYLDGDNDGFGDPAVLTQSCYQPIGWVFDNTDCDDSDPNEHPGQIWYKDLDNDSYSDGITDTTSCERPLGYKVVSELVSTTGDCDDNCVRCFPGGGIITTLSYFGDFVVPIGEDVDVSVVATYDNAQPIDNWPVTFVLTDIDANIVTSRSVNTNANGLAETAFNNVLVGVYTVRASFNGDECLFKDSSLETTVAVYDSSGGFVTGGGWLMSPAGAYSEDIAATGKANFGFNAKYKKGANVPTGNAEFMFHAIGLNFHSTDYQWLVVSGKDKAQFKGRGTRDGDATLYNFKIWVEDSDPDTFRIKIYSEDSSGNEITPPLYDNGSNQTIGGGSIVIHTGGNSKK